MNQVNAGTLANCLSTRKVQVLISRDWMINTFHIYPHVMSVFDTCLLYRSVPCLDQFGTILPNRGGLLDMRLRMCQFTFEPILYIYMRARSSGRGLFGERERERELFTIIPDTSAGH